MPSMLEFLWVVFNDAIWHFEKEKRNINMINNIVKNRGREK